MVTTYQEGHEYLKKLYSPWKLSRMFNKNSFYEIETTILEHCCGDSLNIDFKNSIDKFYLFDLCCNYANYDDVVILAKELLDEDIFDETLKGKKLIQLIDKNTFYYKSIDIANIIWDKITYETKLDIISNRYSSSYKWHGQSINSEELLYFFYLKGFINFTEPSEKNWNINKLHEIPNLTLSFSKKVKVNYTDDIIKTILKNSGRKDYKSRIAYLFTLPELREKFIDNPEWMFFDLGHGKFIDYYPEEERQKYIKVLLKKYKKEHGNKRNIR
jgi:hypothetical protein